MNIRNFSKQLPVRRDGLLFAAALGLGALATAASAAPYVEPPLHGVQLGSGPTYTNVCNADGSTSRVGDIITLPCPAGINPSPNQPGGDAQEYFFRGGNGGDISGIVPRLYRHCGVSGASATGHNNGNNYNFAVTPDLARPYQWNYWGQAIDILCYGDMGPTPAGAVATNATNRQPFGNPGGGGIQTPAWAANWPAPQQ